MDLGETSKPISVLLQRSNSLVLSMTTGQSTGRVHGQTNAILSTTRGHNHKLFKKRCSADVRSKFFSG